MWHEKPTEHCVLRVADEEKKVVVVVVVVFVVVLSLSLSLSLCSSSPPSSSLNSHRIIIIVSLLQCLTTRAKSDIIKYRSYFKCDHQNAMIKTARRGTTRQTRDANGRVETALGRPRPPGARRTRGALARGIPVLHLHPLGPTGMPEENTGGHIQLAVRRVRGGDGTRWMDAGDVSERQHREPVSDAEELFTVCGVLDGS